MNWSSLQEFLHMGGYGLYVWGAIGTTAAAVAIELLALSRRSRAARARVRRPAQRDRA